MDATSITIPGYRIVRVAGRGGMGVVYEALRDDGQRVAVKVVAPEHRESAEFATRFAREARLALDLDHPHIVRLIESGVDADGQPFLAFAYIDGTDLHQRLRQQGRMSRRDTTRIVSQVAQALDAAHQLGLVHRDVKPANVLLNRSGAAFLSDFGLTRPVSGTQFTVSGAWVGTVDYAAPEQIQGHAVDARTDIYSLAAMAYQLLSGVVPFRRDSDMAKLWAHVNEPRPKLPADVEHHTLLDQAIARGMAQDPNSRYVSAGDFARALAAATDGQTARFQDRVVATGAAAPSGAATVRIPVEAGDAPSAAPTVRISAPGRRRWTVGAGIATLAVAGAVGAAVLYGGGPARSGDAARATLSKPEASESRATVTPATTAASTPTLASTPTVAATATRSPTSTASAKRRKSRAIASPRRSDDLPLALDIVGNVPSQVGSWSPFDDATMGAAQQAFGTDYVVDPESDSTACTVDWPALGISVTFVQFGIGDACGVDDGLAQTIRIDGTVTDRWRTLSGLRPGMRETSIPKLYPKARKVDTGDWWLVTDKSPVGGGSYFAPIAATVDANGRVSGFELWVGAGGD